MPRVVMPLSVLVTMQADAAFLHKGCCAGTTSRPAYQKKFDGNGHGSTSAQCQSDCWNQGGNVVTWDNGWCTCWLPQYMTPAQCGFATDAGNCGSDMTNAETYYSFSLALSTKQQLGVELGGTKMPGNGCCAGTTGHPASDKLFDGTGYATTEADCNWKCWNAPYNGNVVTWDPAGNWCTCWKSTAMSPSSCSLATDAGDCGSPMPAAVTSYKYPALSTQQQPELQVELKGNQIPGCCNAVAQPASYKYCDGHGTPYIGSCDAAFGPTTNLVDCFNNCQTTGGGHVASFGPNNWCTCWVGSFHSGQCTSGGSCGSDYSQWWSMTDGFFMADGNSTSGVDVMV